MYMKSVVTGQGLRQARLDTDRIVLSVIYDINM